MMKWRRDREFEVVVVVVVVVEGVGGGGGSSKVCATATCQLLNFGFPQCSNFSDIGHEFTPISFQSR